MAKGKIVNLPCSVGDSVWSLLTNGKEKFVTRFIVKSVEYKQKGIGYEIAAFSAVSDGSYHDLYFYWDKKEYDGLYDVLGYSVFLTEEEAIAYKEKLNTQNKNGAKK